MSDTGSGKWLRIFNKAVRNLKIQSKHAERDPDGEGIQLKLWSSQKRVLEQICAGLDRGIHVFYVLKSRQLGVTTITLAITLFWLALHPNTIGIYVADTEANAEKARASIKKYVASWAKFMGKSFSIVRSNRLLVGFSNGSRLDIRVAGKSKVNWGEGEGYLVGHLTEVAAYGQVAGVDSFRHAMAPQNPRALYIFESTAKGSNFWKDMWDEALEDPTTVCGIFVGWWANETNVLREHTAAYQKYAAYAPTPLENDLIRLVREEYGYDITMEQLVWKRWNDAHSKSGEEDNAQNQPWYAAQSFVETGFSFFNTQRVAQRLNTITEAPAGYLIQDGGYSCWPYRFVLGQDYHLSSIEYLDPETITADDVTLRIWEKPVEGATYAIGFDPAFGRTDWGNNHSCEVYRCFADKMVQVAEYAENDVTTVQATWVLAWLAGRYFPCMVNIDLAGGLGMVVMQEFKNLRDRMQSDWYRSRIGEGFEDFLAAASWYLYHRTDSPGPGYMYGTKTNRDLKLQLMNQMRDSFVTDLLEIRSIPLLNEMLTVRQIQGDIGAAAQGRDKDDRTFATGLANLTWLTHIRPSMVANAITWKSQIAREEGTATVASLALNRMVQSVLIKANEEPEYSAPKTFLDARGLV